MNETRQLYTRLVQRVREALRKGEPDHTVVVAVDTLHRWVGWALGKSKLAVLRDVGLSRARYVEMVYGRDDSDDQPQQHDDRETPCDVVHDGVCDVTLDRRAAVVDHRNHRAHTPFRRTSRV